MRKKLFALIFFVIFIPSYSVAAQEISFAKTAEQLAVNVTIDEQGNVNVEHKIKSDSVPVEIALIPGKISNFSVTNENGKEHQYGTSGDGKKIVIFPSRETIYVRYGLDDVLTNTDDVWKWDFLYTSGSTTFFFPEKLDLVFANDSPVYLGEQKGIKCHGCQMKLEYMFDEPTYIGQVEWEKEKFDVVIRTLGSIESLNFDQPNKTLSLGIAGDRKFVTVVIPLRLLGSPYDVSIDNQPIFKHEFNNNGTHVWLNIRPESSGNIDIIGTTAIPEFSLFAPLVIGMAILIVLQFRNRINLH